PKSTIRSRKCTQVSGRNLIPCRDPRPILNGTWKCGDSCTCQTRSFTEFSFILILVLSIRWRVTEISQILLVLLDSRCPLLHFPPPLQQYLFNRKVILV